MDANQGNHAYHNPYVNEAFSNPEAMTGMGGQDFAPGAESLMYNPPMDWHGDAYGQDEYDGEEGHDDTWYQHIGGSWTGNPTQRGRPTGGGSSGSHVTGGLSTYGGYGAGGLPTYGPDGGRSSSVPRQGRAASNDPPVSPRRVDGDFGDVHPEVTSREMTGLSREMTQSDFDENAGKGIARIQGTQNAGQNTIDAIMKCVQKAHNLPPQQRPNSEKWTDRWANLEPEKPSLFGWPAGGST